MNLPDSWHALQDAISRAQQDPVAVIGAISASADRGKAAAALAKLLEIDEKLADQLLDLHLSDFIARRI